jgi:ribose 5-phosphate isomerase B
MKTLFIASDHAAFEEKAQIMDYLQDRFDIIDLGTNSKESVHYSSYGLKLAKEVASHKESLGIAICGSGIGISMAVNRIKTIRGALCRDEADAKICKEHNNANIICFGSRRNTVNEMKAMTDVWLEAQFEGARHQKRVELLDE